MANYETIADWASGENAELEIVESLYRAATAIEPDVSAAKFLLANLWPARWSSTPHVGKPSAIQAPAGDAPKPTEVTLPPFGLRMFEDEAA